MENSHKLQADIYRIVYDAQEAGINIARAGKTKTDSHNEAVKVVKEGLLKLGLITSKDNDEYRTWFMHGTSHWLGMNVHDVGTKDKIIRWYGLHRRAWNLYPL